MAETVTVRRDGLTLDLLLTIHRGLQGQTLLEQTLDINPGLAAHTGELPHGTQVTLPDAVLLSQTVKQSTVVSLFD